MAIPLKPIRRIVTGHNANGKSIILRDEEAPNAIRPEYFAGGGLTDLWETKQTPACNAGTTDSVERPIHLEPPPTGSIFRIVDFPPDGSVKPADMKKAFDAIQATHTLIGSARHPGFHKTKTVDYAIIMHGEIWALFDEGETLLKAGDVLVQRGTSHGWSNRTNDICRVAFILIDAEPVSAN
jgi:hypothetical protein